MGVILASAFALAPRIVETSVNGVILKPPYHASPRAQLLAKRLLIIDLHADSLLWGRDLNQRSNRGHVDIPRLIEGNVALQAFTIVTKVPRGVGLNSDATGAPDDITLLAIAQLWPHSTLGSLKERALFQTERFRRTAEASKGKLTPIATRAELDRYLELRQTRPATTAGFLGVEGAHALEGNLDNLEVLYDAGVRMMSMTHFFDNDISGSSAGLRKGGLTDKGRELIRRMERKRMLVDVAHASESAIDDILATATRPIVSSHTGVKGTCNNQRNLSDRHLRAIAGTGGLIGIAYFKQAVCGQDAKAIARAVRHAVSLAGVDHVGLGSDFDGAVTAPFDTTGLALLFDALLDEGFSEEEIARIAGLNALRVLREVLP